MAKYLASSVCAEETSLRAKFIAGANTSTTAFVGLTSSGPGVRCANPPGRDAAPTEVSELPPPLLTSFDDFQRIYGGLNDLVGPNGDTRVNYLAHAVRSYFATGGSRLYVVRVMPHDAQTAQSPNLLASGAEHVRFAASFAGSAGTGTATLTERRVAVTHRVLAQAPVGSLLIDGSSDGSSDGSRDGSSDGSRDGSRYRIKSAPAVGNGVGTWLDTSGTAIAITARDDPSATAYIATLAIQASNKAGHQISCDGLGFDSRHPLYVGNVLANVPRGSADTGDNGVHIDISTGVTAEKLHSALVGNLPPGQQARTVTIGAVGGDGRDGHDGHLPDLEAYQEALDHLIGVEDISIVATPGSAAMWSETGGRDLVLGIQDALISHAESRRAYRIAVLDTPRGFTPGEARIWCSRIDSTYAVVYYPWIYVTNPLFRPGQARQPSELLLPPSGFVCGIYAHDDVTGSATGGTHRAPADDIVRGGNRLERPISSGQQEMLNPIGINCLRFFPSRGSRGGGPRLASSDAAFQFVRSRRYCNYLQRSLDHGTKWVMFEPNNPRLWQDVHDMIAQFLFHEWRNGALRGRSPEEAFFVQCNRSVMTQSDLDHGRLICRVGVALLRPAEFATFHIGHNTAAAGG